MRFVEFERPNFTSSRYSQIRLSSIFTFFLVFITDATRYFDLTMDDLPEYLRVMQPKEATEPEVVEIKEDTEVDIEALLADPRTKLLIDQQIAETVVPLISMTVDVASTIYTECGADKVTPANVIRGMAYKNQAIDKDGPITTALTWQDFRLFNASMAKSDGSNDSKPTAKPTKKTSTATNSKSPAASAHVARAASASGPTTPKKSMSKVQTIEANLSSDEQTKVRAVIHRLFRQYQSEFDALKTMIGPDLTARQHGRVYAFGKTWRNYYENGRNFNNIKSVVLYRLIGFYKSQEGPLTDDEVSQIYGDKDLKKFYF